MDKKKKKRGYRPPGVLNDDQWAEAYDYYQQGNTFTAVSKKYGVSTYLISTQFKKRGWKVRPRAMMDKKTGSKGGKVRVARAREKKAREQGLISDKRTIIDVSGPKAKKVKGPVLYEGKCE